MRRYASLLLAFTFPLASFAADDCVGPGDVVVDGVVDSADFSAFLACFVGPSLTESVDECITEVFNVADIDADGDVDLRDFSVLAESFGADYFVYGPHREDLSAEMLAIEISAEVRAPDELYDRIHGDLLRIHDAYPETTVVEHTPRYHPTRLMVRLDLDEPIHVLEPMNEYYQAAVSWSSSGLHLLEFCDTLNMPAIELRYEEIQGVDYASRSYRFGGGSWISIDFFYDWALYVLDLGYGDCPAGCYCARTWVMEVPEVGDVKMLTCHDNCTGSCDVDPEP